MSHSELLKLYPKNFTDDIDADWRKMIESHFYQD